MKKALLFTPVFTITLLTVLMLFILPASADSFSGDCSRSGSSVTWSFDTETGILTLSGNGETYLYSNNNDVPWSMYREQIREVVVEDGITVLGPYLFTDFKNLTTVSIADSVTTIGSQSFSGCSNLKEILLPSALTHIQIGAFQNCYTLESLILPHGTLVIGDAAFSGCENLTTVLIPNTVTTIEHFAFKDCKNLKVLSIPASVTKIGKSVLRGCDSLTTLAFPAGREYAESSSQSTHYFGYSFGASSVYNQNRTVPASLKTVILTGSSSGGYSYFTGCENIETIVLPRELWNIPNFVFEGCTGLKKVVLPVVYHTTNTSSIGVNAFANCPALTTVEYHGTAEQWAALTIDTGNDTIKNNVTLVSCSHSHLQAIDEAQHQGVCLCNSPMGNSAEHAWTEQILRPATHLMNGKTLYTCECGEFKLVTTEKLTDHVWNNGVVTTEPTTEAEGVKTFTCTCGETKTEAIAKLPPSEKNGGGCGSTLSGSIGMIALVTLAGGMIARKKKK